MQRETKLLLRHALAVGPSHTQLLFYGLLPSTSERHN